MNLWQLTQEEMAFISMMEETGGEITPELEEDLAIRRENFESKADSYTKLILKLESDVEAASAEIKRIQDLKKVKENTVKRLKGTLRDALQFFGRPDSKTGVMRYETPLFKLSIRSSQAVEVNDEGILPDEFWAIKKEVSKTLISTAIKEGREVPGATMVENKSLQIR
jgi:hypothetical protein